jgi:hypothetical protein
MMSNDATRGPVSHNTGDFTLNAMIERLRAARERLAAEEEAREAEEAPRRYDLAVRSFVAGKQ